MQPALSARPLTDAQLAQYEHDGFLVIDNFFTDSDLDPVIREVEGKVEALAQRLFASGLIPHTCPGLGFHERLTALQRLYPSAATLLHTEGILGPALADLWSSPRLLDFMQQVLGGGDVAGHPVWNLRTKTPLNPLATVPWHQDTAYLAPGVQNVLQATAWIPLVDVDEAMGTLQVIRGSHRSGEVHRHRLERSSANQASWYLEIEEAHLPAGERVVCHMKKGSFLLLNQLITHRSTENTTDCIRWSIDLRFQDPAKPTGFDAIKPAILLRKAGDPAYRPNWQGWAEIDRVALANRPKANPFDPHVEGPWLTRWQ
jgi:hypothetical protein